MIKTALIVIVVALLVVLIILVGLGFFRTYEVQHSQAQDVFKSGTLPDAPAEGFYRGSVTFMDTNWLGKRFDPKTGRGINVFRKSLEESEDTYPFMISTGTALRDRELPVVKIDYNLPENPWWTRFILDEVVEVTENKFLGKLHVRLIPGHPFTLGFFRLEKDTEPQ